MEVNNIIINPKVIDKLICEINEDLPFNLNKALKEIKKNYNIKNDLEFTLKLAEQIKCCLKLIKRSDYLYTANSFKLGILKFRSDDASQNKGKSSGYRIIGLIDEINSIFILFYIYKHSEGIDNINKKDLQKLKEICDKYSLKFLNAK